MMENRFVNQQVRPDGDLAYRILDGELTWFPLPAGGVLPRELRDAERETDNLGRLHPGTEHARFWSHTLPRIIELSARCTPGVTWWCAPVLDFAPATYAGYSWGSHPVVQLSTANRTRHVVSLAYHEAAHSCEHLCSDAEFDAWNVAAHSTEAWDEDYDDRPEERRAILFEAAATFLACGGDLLTHPAAPANAVLGAIYSGAIGQRRVTRQAVCAPVVTVKPSLSARLLGAVGLGGVSDWLQVPSET